MKNYAQYKSFSRFINKSERFLLSFEIFDVNDLCIQNQKKSIEILETKNRFFNTYTNVINSVNTITVLFKYCIKTLCWAIDCVSFWLWPVRRSKSRSKVKNFVDGQSHVHKSFIRSKLRVKAVLIVWTWIWLSLRKIQLFLSF